jgi:hypothetical protein
VAAAQAYIFSKTKVGRFEDFAAASQRIVFTLKNVETTLYGKMYRPDLKIESMWWRAEGFTDDEDVVIGFNARNWGNAPSTACVYAVRVDGVQKTTGTLPALAPYGGVSTQSNVALGKLAAGAHEIVVAADTRNTVKETDGTNNTLTKPITIAAPPTPTPTVTPTPTARPSRAQLSWSLY